MAGNFIDTNILLYAASADAAKAAAAWRLIGAGGTISVQVLNEAANVAHKKLGWSWREIGAFLSAARDLLDVVPVTAAVHATGLALAERYRLSLYDAMIAAAALLAGCDTLWSEDMQHGARLQGRLRIVNPFR